MRVGKLHEGERCGRLAVLLAAKRLDLRRARARERRDLEERADSQRRGCDFHELTAVHGLGHRWSLPSRFLAGSGRSSPAVPNWMTQKAIFWETPVAPRGLLEGATTSIDRDAPARPRG